MMSAFRCPSLLALLCLASDLLAQDPCVPAPADIVAWWPFNETAGTIAADVVADADGMLTNGPAHATGLVGGALTFDGSNDYVIAADSPLWDFGAKNFTIEFWASFDSTGGGSVGHPQDIFIGNDEGSGTRNKWFFAFGGGVLNFHINGPSVGSTFSPQLSFTPVIGEWYHLAVTRSGNTFTIYVNGTPGASSILAKTIPNANAPLTIGQAEGIGFFGGELDEVSIYHRALAPPELASIYAAGPGGKCLGLSVSPAQGGNSGAVTVHIQGAGLQTTTEVRLEHNGETSIIGAAQEPTAGGTALDASFELDGALVGAWDLVIERSEGDTLVLPGGFEIIDGGAADLTLDAVGLGLMQPGFPQTYWIVVANKGSVDSPFVRLGLRFPSTLEFTPGATPADQAPSAAPSTPGLTELTYFLHPVPAGGFTSIPLTLKSTAVTDFSIEGVVALPALTPPSGSTKNFSTGEYPIVWDCQPSGPCDPPPPGYVVYYDWNGVPSMAISLGNGKVAHWVYFPDPEKDGLVVHPMLLSPPHDIIAIMQPPGWTIEKGQALASEFESGGKWVENTDLFDRVFEFTDTYDGKSTAYFPTPHWIETPGDLIGMCAGGAQYLWPDLEKANTNCFASGSVASDDYYELYQYWQEQGYGTRLGPYLWPSTLPTVQELWMFCPWNAVEEIKFVQGVTSVDPNEKVGPVGAGAEAYVAVDAPLPHAVFFENDPEKATAPAKIVRISDAIDPSLYDLGSISLGPISFGDVSVVPPPASTWFTTLVDLNPSQDLYVRVVAGLDLTTGLLTWELTAIDPATGAIPTNPLIGFLPPNVVPPEGDGNVLFTVRPLPTLSTGELLTNRAAIIFDFNEPILTPVWTNTIDADVPTSSVGRLPAITVGQEVSVTWSGSDIGAGIQEYAVYVSTDGSPFEPWLTSSNTSAVFVGEGGRSYGFASQATDGVGNVEPFPMFPEATTTIEASSPWADLGGGTPGIAGQSTLRMLGPLTMGSVVGLNLVNAAPSAPAVIIISLLSAPIPFLGGTLYPFPPGLLVYRLTDSQGEINESAHFPGATSGVEVWFQVAVRDASVPGYGASLSNGVKGTVR